jgi:site-specific DNA recombinase
MAARAIAVNPALKTQPKIAVGISRVSLIIQAGNYSIAGQQAQIRSLEKKYGFEIPEGYLLDDEGYSGTNFDRPAIRRAMRMIKAGEANAVVFPYLDRFARKVEFGLTMIRKFREAGADVLFGEVGWVDDSVMCKVLITNLLMVAEMQRDSIAARSRDGVRHKIESGLAHGGRSPFGYHFVTALEIAAEALNRGEQPPPGKPRNIHRPAPQDIGTLNLIAQLVLAGMSAKGVCRELLARGVKSPKGKPRWNPTTVASLMRDLCYSAGVWHYGKREGKEPELRRKLGDRHSLKTSWRMRPESEWMAQPLPGGPIWAPEYQQSVIEALGRNRRLKVGARAAKTGWEALLKGLCVCKRILPSGEVCGKCITPVHKHKPGHRPHFWYVCGHRDRVTSKHLCSMRHFKADVIEEAVWRGAQKAVMEDLDALVAAYHDEICSTIDASELERMKAEERRLRTKKDEARDREMHADDADDKRYYASQLSEFKSQLAMLQRRIACVADEAERVEVDTIAIRNQVRDIWETEARSERREFLTDLISVIDWLSDEEIELTIRIPRKGCARVVNGQHDQPVVDHYLLLKTKVRVAA